jgi:peptidoglycan/xylan/chitin deacetylase (PgdA/CDA1 family)
VTTVPVLLYHSISSRSAPRDAPWSVTPRQFAAHCEAVAAAGCRSLTVTELAACLRGARELPERPVVLTFDDGYADVLDVAAGLAERGLAATVYVTTGLLGAPGMLHPRALAELAALPTVEVGAHGIRHDRLDELGGPALVAETTGSRAALEDVTQRGVTSFAYPHGAYDRRAREAVIAAGYEAGAAVKNALSHTHDDPFAIARWTVRSGTSVQRIAELIEGRGAPLAWPRERVRTRAARAGRRLRRAAVATRGRS